MFPTKELFGYRQNAQETIGLEEYIKAIIVSILIDVWVKKMGGVICSK